MFFSSRYNRNECRHITSKPSKCVSVEFSGSNFQFRVICIILRLLFQLHFWILNSHWLKFDLMTHCIHVCITRHYTINDIQKLHRKTINTFTLPILLSNQSMQFTWIITNEELDNENYPNNRGIERKTDSVQFSLRAFYEQ